MTAEKNLGVRTPYLDVQSLKLTTEIKSRRYLLKQKELSSSFIVGYMLSVKTKVKLFQDIKKSRFSQSHLQCVPNLNLLSKTNHKY